MKKQKIIALLPFKNEEWILPTYISSIYNVVDEVIAMDDGSTDNSVEILKKSGAILFDNKNSSSKFWTEHNMREVLLEKGRERGGTHFVCLDADEIFDAEFVSNSRKLILDLSPGESMYFKWKTLWMSLNKIRIDGVYKNLEKDFIFCDDGKMKYPYAFVGVKRTPSGDSDKITKTEYSVIHFQHFNFEKNQLKQAWYRCSELLNGGRSAKRINNMYTISRDGSWIKTSDFSLDQYGNALLPEKEIINESSWHLLKIKEWFDEKGIEFFEPLDIWHIDQLKEMFVCRIGRLPKPKTYPRFLVFVNNLKNTILNKVRNLK